MNMRHVTFVTVAILTFALGVLMSFVTRFTTSEQREIQPISKYMEDDRHRLFEAAQMSNDEHLRDEVLGRLQCMGDDGSLNRRPVNGLDTTHCVEFDGVSWSSSTDRPMDGAYYSILKTHGAWSRKNMPFIRSIADPSAARLYILERLSSE